jgi:hypothetical protein
VSNAERKRTGAWHKRLYNSYSAGARDYPPTAGEFDAGRPVVRAILGGTGKYMGARGQLTSTRNADGSYTQVFTLLK